MKILKRPIFFAFLAALAISGAHGKNFSNAGGSESTVADEETLVPKKKFSSSQVDSDFSERRDSSVEKPAQKPQRMRLFLRELAVLKKAAKAAGGDIKVSIQPVGISSEQLVEELARLDWFDISPGDDAVIIRSRKEDPYVAQMRAEVDQLDQKRNALMKDVKELERMLVQGEDKMRSLQETAQQQQQARSLQDRGVVRPQASMQQGGAMPVPATFPNQRIPDQYPEGSFSRSKGLRQQENEEEVETEDPVPASPRSTVMLAPNTKGVKTK